MDVGYGGGDGGGYSTTSYGSKGAAGGGGFMASGSQGDGGENKAAKETLRPVTIKQMMDADQPHPDASFKISGVPAVQVTFVGQIRNVSAQATNYTYKIDDGTGIVEVKRWIDPQENSAMDEDGATSKPQLEENAYVRIFGTLKTFGNKRHVVVRPAGIRLVEDMNEVQMHLLEATAVHLFFERGPPNAQQNGQAGNGQGGGDTYMNGTGGGAAESRPPAGVSRTAGRVLQHMQSVPQTNEGLNVDEIAASIGLEIGEVQNACSELSGHGIIFPTVDEDTWALMDKYGA